MRTVHVFFSIILVATSVFGAEPPPAAQSAGYVARKLPLPVDILPSCMAVRAERSLVVGSMDGDILLVRDTDRDGIPDCYVRLAGTLPHWPLGLRAENLNMIVATRSS